MNRKQFTLSLAAAALFAAFGPANAQTINASPNVGVDANVGISNTDANLGASSDANANQSSSTQSSGIVTSGANNEGQSVSSTSADTNASPGNRSVEGSAAAGASAEKKKGLDQADEAAGEKQAD